MEQIKKRLKILTQRALQYETSEGAGFDDTMVQINVFQELFKVWQAYEKQKDALTTEPAVKQRLDETTKAILRWSDKKGTLDGVPATTEEIGESYVVELKRITELIKIWASVEGTEIEYTDNDDEPRGERKSTRTWDNPDDPNTLTTAISLTDKQKTALRLLDDKTHDMLLLLGGSGSGKSFVAIYKIIRDALRYGAPCLCARDKYVDLAQGIIDQTVPTILNLIAEANGHKGGYKTWKIDGLSFAKMTDKRTKLEFATGGYIRFAGLSIRDLSESGSDKILSPSWFHIELEEGSELDIPIIEKLQTRLRHPVPGKTNKLIITENPPSINHFTYKRWFERKREDGSSLSKEEFARYASLNMHPRDNVENLGETYIRNLSQLSESNRKRFYDGEFQDMEDGEIFKKMSWTSNLPRAIDWEKLIVYCDPTPLTTREHSPWADYKASVLAGMFDGYLYILEVRAVRGSTMDMLNSIKQLYDESPNQSITDVWMENKAIPSDFNQVLVQFSTLTGWMIPIQKDKRKFGEKKAAIETFLQPVFEQGQILFNDKFRDTERGRQTQLQILKFSRKDNKNIHDDIPDAIMKAYTKMNNKQRRRRHTQEDQKSRYKSVRPGFIKTECYSLNNG